MSFASARTRIQAVEKAGGTLDQLQSIYRTAVALKAKRDLYQAGTDPAFNAAFEAVFNVPADRAAIADMIGDLVSLVADWEATHNDVITE